MKATSPQSQPQIGLTQAEKDLLPKDLVNLSQKTLEDIVAALANNRMQRRIAESAGLLKGSRKLYDNIELECRAGLLSLVYEVRAKLEETTRGAAPFEDAISKLASIPIDDPRNIEEFVIQLGKKSLIKRDQKHWWVALTADFSCPASIRLSEKINEHRRNALLKRVEFCHSLKKLYEVAEHFVEAGIVKFIKEPRWSSDPDEERLLEEYPEMFSTYRNFPHREIAFALSEGFNKKRADLIRQERR